MVEDNFDCQDKMYCWSWGDGQLEDDVRLVAKVLADGFLLNGINNLFFGENFSSH